MIRRRLQTIPLTILLWVAVTLLMPLLTLAVVLIDAARKLITGRPFIATRLLAIGWVYLAAQVGVIILSAGQWVASLPSGRKAAARRCQWSYWLQGKWVATIMAAMKRLFRLDFVVSGADDVAPGPIIVLFRHVSIMDNLLPHAFVSEPNNLRLRWVLKKELLRDPALDIGGNRMPNYFVDRKSDDSQVQLEGIAALGSGLGPGDGVLLFPEGTRFSEKRRKYRLDRLAASDPDLHKLIAPFEQVLPPKTGGVLALLDTGADVIVAAHAGFEELRGIKEIWAAAPVGRTISMAFRRYPASDIPRDPAARKQWLFSAWAWVGSEVASMRAHTAN